MIRKSRFLISSASGLIALLLFLWSLAVFAAQPAPQTTPQQINKEKVSPAPPPPPPPKAAPAPPPIPRPTFHGGSSSFFFDDADVFEVIQTVFGEALRVNYIIDPAVKGRVNFRTTTPIPRDRILPVMEIILRLNGIAVVEEAGLYRIIPIGNISKEPAPIRFGKSPESVELKGTALMQIVPLTFISSTEMAAILTPLLTQGGAIHDISKRNILIIADTDANIRRLLQVIEKFDTDPKTATNQPRIYVYPVQNSKAKAVSDILNHVLLGGAAPPSSTSSVKTSSGSTTTTTASGSAAGAPKAGPVTSTKPAGGGGETLVSPSTKIYPDEANNTLVILSTPSDYSVILSAIKQIDILPRQVMIEAVVASVTLDDNLTFGLKWSARVNANLESFGPLSTNPQTLLGNLGFQNLSKLSASTFGYQLTDKSGGVRLQIEALAANDKAKILSAPQLLVADNKKAKIQVGQQVPLATSTTTTPTASTSSTVVNTTTSTVQYKDVGTILEITPQINDSGLVSLEIRQEVSDAATKSVLGTDQYVITKNEVNTNLVVQDGETIIIGGLVFESVTYNVDGIPILNKIPILNLLAGSTTDNKKRQELVILLTPRVIRNPEAAKKLTSDYSERFRNVEKEIDVDRHLKTYPGKEANKATIPTSQSQTAPAASPAAQTPSAPPAKAPATSPGPAPKTTPVQPPQSIKPSAQQPSNNEIRKTIPAPTPQPAKPTSQQTPDNAPKPTPTPAGSTLPVPYPPVAPESDR